MKDLITVNLTVAEYLLEKRGLAREATGQLMPRLCKNVLKAASIAQPVYDFRVEHLLVQDANARRPVQYDLTFTNIETLRRVGTEIDVVITEAIDQSLLAVVNRQIRTRRTVPGMIYGNGYTRQVYIEGKKLDPKPSQRVKNHSPDGFNWGYGGSGPSQLALAILLKFMKKDEAAYVYHLFKRDKISGLTVNEDFFLPIDEVTTWIAENRGKLAA